MFIIVPHIYSIRTHIQMNVNQQVFLSVCPPPPIADDEDTTSSLSHMNKDISKNNQTPSQSSAYYMNYMKQMRIMYLNQSKRMVLKLLIMLLVMLLMCYVNIHG